MPEYSPNAAFLEYRNSRTMPSTISLILSTDPTEAEKEVPEFTRKHPRYPNLGPSLERDTAPHIYGWLKKTRKRRQATQLETFENVSTQPTNGNSAIQARQQ